MIGFSLVMFWKENGQINCTAQKIQNRIPNIVGLSDYFWDKYKKGVE